MIDNDTVLQEQLARLEKGISLEQVLAELPAESSGLAPLICLAFASSHVNHPVLSVQVAQTQRAMVVAAAKQRKSHRTLPFWLANRRISFALAGGFALIVLAMIVSLMLPGTAYAQANLVDMNGMVEVAPDATSGDWHFVAAGETVHKGERVHTYADSNVTLAYHDGSRTVVGPNSDLVLTQLDGQNTSLQVQLTQNSGLTSNTVVPLSSTGSIFLVDTPSGSATVHGTTFNVDVGAGGNSIFTVSHGKVSVSQDGTNVLLAAGQSAGILPGQTVVETGYQFTLDGPVNSIDGKQWVVNGVPFDTGPQTMLVGTFKVGDPVFVQGRILDGNQWLADRIEPSRKDHLKSSFTGLIESITIVPGIWKIGGYDVQIIRETDLESGLQVGSAVEVSVIVQTSGSWLVKSIANLEIEQEKPTTTPQTSTPSATPTGTGLLIPTETSTPTPALKVESIAPTATVVPKNDSSRCDNRDQQQPEGLRLAARYKVTYEEIMTWFCKGFGFGEIDLAYGLSRDTGKLVSEIFSMRSSGLDWGQIKKDLSPNPQKLPGASSNGNSGGSKAEKTPGPRK